MWTHPPSCCLNRLRTTFPCMAVDCLADVMVRLVPPGRAKKKKKKKTNETSVVLGIVSDQSVPFSRFIERRV